MQPVKTKKKLSRADRKQIEAAIARANRTDKKEKSAQDSIPYERMWPDGICRVSDGHYTKTIQFQDINYQLSQNEDKTAIFEGWCDFLNYFDSSIQFELSFLSLAASEETFARAINIPLQRDDFDSIRVEYTTMLQNQLAKGNNGLIKTKYLTFGIDADSIKAAKPRLERIETDILNNFKRLGVAAETLDGKARLAQLHGIFHMDEQLPFRFEWDWLPTSGLSTKDFIAPSSFEFRTGRQFRMGKKYGAVSFLQILAPELNDRMLADFLDMESSLIVSLHIQSVDQIKAIKTVKRKITDLDKSKIEEQKKAVRAGYDMDIIPSDLATYREVLQAVGQNASSIVFEIKPDFRGALSTDVNVISRLIGALQQNRNRYRSVVLSGKTTTGERQRQYDLYEEYFKYPISVSEYRQENGQKIEREKAEILRDYRLNMMNVYNEYKDIILAVSNR